MLDSSVKWSPEQADNSKAHTPHFVHDTPLEDDERIEGLFKSLDLDGNGKIDIHDLCVTLKGAGVNPVYAKVCISTKTTHAF